MESRKTRVVYVSSSSLHERFQTWQNKEVFYKLFKVLVKYYAHKQKLGWKWQSVDSKMVPAPLGGSQTGKNPTDLGKSRAKIHILVDEKGAPLAIHLTGANEHEKWSVDDLVVHIVAKRPHSEQHLCADKSYNYEDVHQFVKEQRYLSHIKHRRRRNEPKVVGLSSSWRKEFSIPALGGGKNVRMVSKKRRSIKIRW